MRKQPDSLDAFASQLSSLAPAEPSRDLALRLEMALQAADEELAERRPADNIIHHPFVQWASAAAALFVAMLFAMESTRQHSPATDAMAASSPTSANLVSEPLPVYQVVNGEMVPTTNDRVLGRASYKGIRVVDGKVYRHYQRGRDAYWQPALKSAE